MPFNIVNIYKIMLHQTTLTKFEPLSIVQHTYFVCGIPKILRNTRKYTELIVFAKTLNASLLFYDKPVQQILFLKFLD